MRYGEALRKSIRVVSAIAVIGVAGWAGSAVVPIKGKEGARMQVWVQSSLKRVFPRSDAGTSTSYELPSGRNQRLSLQLCARNESTAEHAVECTVTQARDLKVRIRRVGYVPMDHTTAHTDASELEDPRYLPGMVPDPLYPECKGTAGPHENIAFWVTVDVPADVPPGPRDLAFNMLLPDQQSVPVTARIDVRPFTLQKRSRALLI